MTAKVLYEDLTSRDVHLSVETGNLKIIAPRGILTEADRAAMREHKAELLTFLRSSGGQPLQRATRPVLSLATREVMRRLDSNVETPCCGVRFAFVNRERVCPSCKLHWSDEDLRELAVYLQQKREGTAAR